MASRSAVLTDTIERPSRTLYRTWRFGKVLQDAANQTGFLEEAFTYQDRPFSVDLRVSCLVST